MKKNNFWNKLKGAVTMRNREDDEEIEMIETTEILAEESILDGEEEGELAIDMFQTASEIIIKAMVAGVKPEDLDVSITRDMVTIHGRRTNSYNTPETDFFHKELYWGSFGRTIVLPSEIEIEEAEAKEQHGLLTLILPKIDKNRQSKLKVRTN